MKNTTNSKNMKYFYFFVLWLKGYETPSVVTRSLCVSELVLHVWQTYSTVYKHSPSTKTQSRFSVSIAMEDEWQRVESDENNPLAM